MVAGMQVAASESMNAALGADLSKAKGCVTAVLAEAGRARLEARELQRFLNATRSELAARDREYRSLDTSRGVLVRRVGRLSAELARQVDLVAKKNAYIRDLERGLEESQTAGERLERQLEVLGRTRAQLESEVAGAARRLDTEREAVREERRVAESYRRGLVENSRRLTVIQNRQQANEQHSMVLGRQTAAAVEREEDMRGQVLKLCAVVAG